MNIGEKIKLARTSKNMTQSQLSDGYITRNMLSAIECGKSSPSLDTLVNIAKKLDLPVSYFLSESDDYFEYRKIAVIGSIRKLYNDKDYKGAINLIEELNHTDDELDFLLTACHFELGKQAMLTGALITAKHHLKLSKVHCENTVYDTTRYKMLITLYTALAENIQSPMLEFNGEYYETLLRENIDFELYKYVIQDSEYPYTYSIFDNHRKAKLLMKDRKYNEALKLLNEIVDSKNSANYNSHVMFLVYTDMETCCKQLVDFENAYKYASKRLSMIEGFKA